jgi:hypothetical protein
MEPLETLLAIEEIKKLKAKYFECIDFQDWDRLAELFTPDAVVDYCGHPRNLIEQHGASGIEPPADEWVFTGGKATADFLKPLFAQIVSAHHGHDPQIEITGPDTAKGLWALYDRLEMPDEIYQGFGHYRDEYVRRDGKWLHSRLVLSRRTSTVQRRSADVTA